MYIVVLVVYLYLYLFTYVRVDLARLRFSRRATLEQGGVGPVLGEPNC